MRTKLKPPVITLTTDFGIDDYFVGVMKGVILSINPKIKLIDITHNISPFQIRETAFLVSNFFSYFPPKTIHLIVVDPGVGTKRRAIIAKIRDYFFVAPDNGVLSYVYQKEKGVKVYEITRDEYFLKPVSQTFHGRDIFAPVAAYLSQGISPDKFGKIIKEYEHFSINEAVFEKNHIKGEILYCDRFGNLITNITKKNFEKALALPNCKIFKIGVKSFRIDNLSSSYSAGKANTLSAIWGSHGYLEIFLKNENAHSEFGIKPGTKVTISFW